MLFNERNEAVRKIRELDIPKTDLAAIAGVPAPRIAEFINGRPLAATKVQKIISAVDDVAFVWCAMAPYKLDTSNPEIFRKAVQQLRAMARKLGTPTPLESPEAVVVEESRA